MSREGHIEQALHMLGYLKSHNKLRLLYDSSYPTVKEKWFSQYDWMDFYRDAKEAMPPNMPEERELVCPFLFSLMSITHATNQIEEVKPVF